MIMLLYEYINLPKDFTVIKSASENTHTKKMFLLISRPKDISFDILACISGAPNQVSTGILQFNY